MPRVSVLMPVYNSENFLSEAIDSVLSQTFSDFELIILNDGSTDRTKEILDDYTSKDLRIKVYHQQNQGIAKTRNRLIELTSAPLIAWMDSDDICSPQRLTLQVAYLESHLDIVAVGSVAELIDEDGDSICMWPSPLTHDEIDALHIRGRGGAIIFPSSMMRKKNVLRAGGFDESLTGAEDLCLFLRMAEVGQLANLEQCLLQYRQHITSISHAAKLKVKQDTIKVIQAAALRRNIEKPIMDLESISSSTSRIFTKWAWWSLKGKNIKTARKYARKTFLKNPFSINNWKLLFCVLRGY